MAHAAGTVGILEDGFGCPYLTIQDAVDAADDGETVIIEPGLYIESVRVDRSLTIAPEIGDPYLPCGAIGGGGVVIRAPAGQRVMSIQGPAAVFLLDLVLTDGFGDDDGSNLRIDSANVFVHGTTLVLGSDAGLSNSCLYARNATLTLDDSALRFCSSGVTVHAVDTTLQVIDTDVMADVGGIAATDSDIFLTGSTLVHSASAGYGVGLLTGGSTLEMAGGSIASNAREGC